MDVLVASGADDERLAPHSRHERGPRGLARSRLPERLEAGDLVDCHRGAGLAELAYPFAEPSDQLLAGIGNPGGRGVADDRLPVLPQGDPAETRYQVRLAFPVPFGLEAAVETAALAKSCPNISLGDRACLALASWLQATAWTTDKIWAKLPLQVPPKLLR